MRSLVSLVALVVAVGTLAACSSASEELAGPVVSTPAGEAPTYRSCEELGPVFDRAEEYQRSVVEEGVVIFELSSGTYLVDADDAACLARYPRIAEDVADVDEMQRRGDVGTCRGLIDELLAGPDLMTVGPDKEQVDVTDEAARARWLASAREICPKVGIAVPAELE